MAGGTTRMIANCIIVELTSDDGILVDWIGVVPDVPTIVYWNEPR